MPEILLENSDIEVFEDIRITLDNGAVFRVDLTEDGHSIEISKVNSSIIGGDQIIIKPCVSNVIRIS